MMITRSRALFALVATALVACSSAPPDSPLQGQDPAPTPKKKSSTATNNNDSEGQQTTNSGTVQQQNPSDPAAPGTPATPGTPAPGTGQCAAAASFDACFQCCDTAFPGGFDLDSNAFGQCVCQSPGTCAAACGTSFCIGAQATPACEQCLATATQCETTAEAACNANQSCAGAFACFDSSGCEQKP